MCLFLSFFVWTICEVIIEAYNNLEIAGIITKQSIQVHENNFPKNETNLLAF